MAIQLVLFVDVPASRALSGTATVPDGATLEFANVGEGGTRIPNGSFDFPVKEEE